MFLRIGGRNRAMLWGVVLASLCSLAYLEGFGSPSSNHPKKGMQNLTGSPGGDMMRIHFERTGGFAGMGMAATIDTGSLSQEEAAQLRDLVEAAGFFDLPAEVTGPERGADRFLYRLTVEMEGRRHTVRTSDAAVPAALRPLIDWLTKAARKARRSGGTP